MPLNGAVMLSARNAFHMTAIVDVKMGLPSSSSISERTGRMRIEPCALASARFSLRFAATRRLT